MKLKSYRKGMGLTQRDVAAAVDVRASAISRYEAGRVPEPPVMTRLYLWSQGAVCPNDFYDLPPLPNAQSGVAA